jgi:hypothetical protein
MKRKQNRRKFLSIGGFLTGAALLAPVLKASATTLEVPDEETIKLLTPDGKLVEVSKHIVQNARNGAKVSNEEILNWTNVPKIKP